MKTRAVEPAADRFWRHVIKGAGCWLWSGAKTNGGYGLMQRGRRGDGQVRAHRLSWEIHRGALPSDPNVDVCHHCDTPSCVRPDHLFLGTAKANVADMVSKGRARGGSGRGQSHHRAKLVDSQVISIREMYASGAGSLQAIAARYGVSKKTVLNIIHRRVWVHL